MHHTWALLAVTQLNFGVMFGTFGFVQTTPTLVTDFGYPESSSGDAFLIIQCYLTVYGKLSVSLPQHECTSHERGTGVGLRVGIVMPVVSILMNAFTRRLEFSADAYSAQLGFDLGPALIAISKTNLGEVSPDWLVSMCHDNHPTLVERLDALERLKKKA